MKHENVVSKELIRVKLPPLEDNEDREDYEDYEDCEDYEDREDYEDYEDCEDDVSSATLWSERIGR